MAYKESETGEANNTQELLTGLISDLAVNKDALKRTTTSTPTANRIQDVRVAQNTVIQSGQVLMEIILTNADYGVSASLKSVAIEGVHMGKKVALNCAEQTGPILAIKLTE